MSHLVDWPGLWYNLWHLGAPDTTVHPVSLLEKLVRPALVYLLLVFLLRRAGKRVLAQLNPFDFVVLLTLSNTVQNAIIGNDTSLLGGAVGAAALLFVNAVLVRIYYRGPEMEQISKEDRDVCLIAGGVLQEEDMRRLHINAGELTAKAHERGFDSLQEIETAVLYPNGTIYFRGADAMSEQAQYEEIIRRLDALGAQVAALRG
ncbi:MAG: DUF421 domain-containing protein [Gemmatimonadales bacterium]|jgi:uncharacterized membrane protein YcaP (DUF421 family)